MLALLTKSLRNLWVKRKKLKKFFMLNFCYFCSLSLVGENCFLRPVFRFHFHVCLSDYHRHLDLRYRCNTQHQTDTLNFVRLAYFSKKRRQPRKKENICTLSAQASTRNIYQQFRSRTSLFIFLYFLFSLSLSHKLAREPKAFDVFIWKSERIFLMVFL